MIILHLLAALLLIPLTALMVVLFNIFLIHWLYLVFNLVVRLIYAFLCSFVFFDGGATAWIFMLLSTLYMMRMAHLAYKWYIKKTDRKFPWLRGQIRNKKFRITFLFPLSFFNIFKILPNFISRELKKITLLDIELLKFLELVLSHSIGTRMEIRDEEIDLCFEIH